MNYKIVHKTQYIYHEPISLCHNIARLTPRSTNRQECKKSTITIDPVPDVMNEFEDFFGNKVVYFAIQQEHKSLLVTVSSEIERLPAETLQGIETYGKKPWEEARMQLYQPRLDYIEARQYVPETPATSFEAYITSYTLQSFTPGRPIYEAVYNLMERIYKDFEFKPGFTTVATPISEVMAKRKGVCQDFAHVGIACIRSVGLPARYVSGYIETLPPPGVEKLVGVDASHAWFSVFIPNIGWLDFDPTNNVIPSEQHITIGWGRDYFDITPLKGVILSSGPHTLSVSVDVRRVGGK
ncbi:transglutaminase family protein [Parasediminibacterium sp. JCM 36343]|uniref:transglutaminase family protein n=1 Tax=Parasediminibacterium sp. JCM 36343 TaxID=3374279 RepID=UPI00397A6C81